MRQARDLRNANGKRRREHEVPTAAAREIGDLHAHAHHDRLIEIGLVFDRDLAEPRARNRLGQELALDRVVKLRGWKLLEPRAKTHRCLSDESLRELDRSGAVAADLTASLVE